jgi:hypothetical protein
MRANILDQASMYKHVREIRKGCISYGVRPVDGVRREAL